MIELGQHFWENRYQTNNIGWDLGIISKPLQVYFDQLKDKNLKILIPGGGNSYEAEYLHHKGFNNVYVVDLAEKALSNIKDRVPTFPSSHLLCSDFFELSITFDLIIEQTFFCAIDPSLRSKYVTQAYKLLNKGGKLVGLLFDAPLYKDHPPFGGTKEEYLSTFLPYFDVEIMTKCYNSDKSRAGKELFIKLVKI